MLGGKMKSSLSCAWREGPYHGRRLKGANGGEYKKNLSSLPAPRLGRKISGCSTRRRREEKEGGSHHLHTRREGVETSSMRGKRRLYTYTETQKKVFSHLNSRTEMEKAIS